MGLYYNYGVRFLRHDYTGEIMSDNTNIPPEEVVFTITWIPKDGSVKVDGPIRNEPIAFWLLEKAKRVVEMANMREAASRITPAPPGLNIRGR